VILTGSRTAHHATRGKAEDRQEEPMQAILGRRGAAIAVLLTLALFGLGPPAPSIAGTAPNDSSGAGETKQPIDLNRASAAELITIPGIGKTLAQRIVEFREDHGPFSRVEDLMKVKGIGEKSFQKIRPYLKVSKTR
jgi:comEA protein